MLEIKLCRVCLADGIRMYPIKHTRYHEVLEWCTEDTLDMNDELPYSVCYLCNAMVNRVYNFLKSMIDTEIYLKEILRNTSKLTYESVKKLKSEMFSKPHNLSKVWLRNSNFIAADAFKGHRPPRELQRYFDCPPIMIEYHKPYEHMEPGEQELEEINEEELQKRKEAEIEEEMDAKTDEVKEAETDSEIKEAKAKKIKEAKTEEQKEAETEVIIEVETEQIKESKSEEIKVTESPQRKSKLPEQESKSPHRVQKVWSEHSEEKSPENEDQQKPHDEKFKNQPDNTDKDSEKTEDQGEFPNNDDEIISIEEDMTLVWSPEIENESHNIPYIEIDDEPFIENNNSSEQSNQKSQSNFSNNQTKIPDPIDSFLLCAKNYRPPEEIAKSSNKNATKEAVTTNLAKKYNPYLEFIEEPTAVDKDPLEKKVKTPVSVEFHNPYLQFIEERIDTEENPQEKSAESVKYRDPCLQFLEQRIPTEEKPPKKRPETSKQSLKTPYPDNYQNENLQYIERIFVKETEPEQTPKQIEIDNYIHTNTPSVQQKSTVLTATQLEERYYNLYLESENETSFKISNEPIVIEKLTPVGGGPNNPVLKSIKPTDANEPSKIIVTSEPKKYIHSYVDFVKEIEYGTSENAKKLVKDSNEVPVPPKSTRKRKLKKKCTQTPVLDKPYEKIYIDGQISGYCYFDNQKRYRRASILKQTHHPNRNKSEIQQLANKIKNRAATLRKEHLQTGLNAEKLVEENAVTKPTPNDEDQPPGISELLTEIPLKLPQDNKNIMKWHVVVKSKHTDRVSDELKDQNQCDQYNNQVTLKYQNNVINLEDKEDTNNQMWSDQDDNTVDSQVDVALKVLEESLKDEDRDTFLRNEDEQVHNMPNDQNNHTLTDNNDPSLQLKDVCIIIEEDLEDNNKPKDQDDPSVDVHDVFTLKNQVEDLIPKEQYDQIIMLANQDDQIMEDGNVAVKIESVDEEFQGSFEENHEEDKLLPDTEIFNNEDIMDPNNDSDDMIQHSDIKKEVEQNMQIDEEVSECEPYLQERVTLHESATQRDQDSPSKFENPDLESNYYEIQGLNEQEHYAIHSIGQISMMPTVQLERLPIGLCKKNSSEINSSVDENGIYSCARCDFKTTTRVLMFRHQNVHDMNKQFVCSVCQHRFLSQYHLSRHKVIHDRTKHYCSYCDFKTTMKFVLMKHEDEHNKFNRFPCNRCQRRFRSANHRSRHACTKISLRKSKVCNKKSQSEATYKCHLDKHTGVIPVSYKCGVCYKSFDTEKKYLNHYKQHGREDSEKRKYTCRWCDKNFSYLSNYNKHTKLHEKFGEKVSRETEDKHVMYETYNDLELDETERKEDEKFVCSLCPKSFDTEIELGKHAVDHIL